MLLCCTSFLFFFGLLVSGGEGLSLSLSFQFCFDQKTMVDVGKERRKRDLVKRKIVIVLGSPFCGIIYKHGIWKIDRRGSCERDIRMVSLDLKVVLLGLGNNMYRWLDVKGC
jgi:hypothetical protein